MDEDWSLDIFDKLETDILEDSFILNNLNYTHYFEYDPEALEGCIISTSVRLYPNNNKWIKRVVTRYLDTNLVEHEISYERETDDSLIKNVEKNTDLRKLNNSYSKDQSNFERFEITYNTIYKIIGDITISIPDIDYIRNILTINDTLEDERKKVSELL